MIKPKFRKYRHLLFDWILDLGYQYSRRIKSLYDTTQPRTCSPLESTRLPYPVKWHKFYEFDEIYVEIGTGHGELIQHYAKKFPEDLHVGFEITKKYAKKTHNRIKDYDNAIAFKGDAYELSLGLFQRETVRGVHILFPDPWHKRKHHKRRPLVDTWFRKMHKKLTEGGYIFFATDWPEYFDFVLDQSHIANSIGEKDVFSIEHGEYVPDEWDFVPTHYYKKWAQLGREFRYIILRKL